VLQAAGIDFGKKQDEEIYDFENATSEPKYEEGLMMRETTSELAGNIAEIRAYVQTNKGKLTLDDAKTELDSPKMRYLHYSRAQLKECLFEMFERLGLLGLFDLPRDRLRNYIAEVEHHYKRVPYHNFTHAFNIVHFVYIVLRTTKLREYLEEIDVLAIMVGALGHDIDHSGMNNMYYSKQRHPLALAVNDTSVLENYHCYMLFHLLFNKGNGCNNFTAHLPQAQQARFRKAVIESVLGTDMVKHFSISSAFQGVIEKIKAGTFDKAVADDRDVR
jgi:hypothetical protein